MIKIINIPKVGYFYPSIDREVVARVLDVYETDNNVIMVYYRTYEGESETPLESFWRNYKNEPDNG